MTLREAMLDAGWLDLSNARGYVKADGRQVELVGVDDPHIGQRSLRRCCRQRRP